MQSKKVDLNFCTETAQFAFMFRYRVSPDFGNFTKVRVSTTADAFNFKNLTYVPSNKNKLEFSLRNTSLVSAVVCRNERSVGAFRELATQRKF